MYLSEIAYKEGLEMVDTTTSPTGYPQNIRRALVGFDNFQQIEEVAEKYGLIKIHLFKKDGWNIFCRTNNIADEPYDMTEIFNQDHYATFTNEDAEDFYDNEVRFILENARNWNDLEALIKEKKDIYEAIENLDEDEIAVTFDGILEMVCKCSSVCYHEDATTYKIGLIEE